MITILQRITSGENMNNADGVSHNLIASFFGEENLSQRVKLIRYTDRPTP